MRFLITQRADPPTRRIIEAKRFVQMEPVKYTTIISPVSERGRISSVTEIDLVAEASGKILQGDIPLKKGAEFKKGDLLFTIYPDEAVLALKAKKSLFLNTLATMLPDISIDFPQYEEAFKAFFSSVQISEALPEFPDVNDEKLRIFLASRNVPSDYYNIRKDELQLSRHAVRAPFDGSLTDAFMEVGAYTNTGGKVANAIRTDELELEVPLEQIDAEWVKINDPVTIHSDKRSLSWKGKVIRKSQFVDENTQSQSVFIKIQNNGSASLLSGEYLKATFPGHPIYNAMEIPRNAVFNTNEVFIIRNGRLQNKIINIIKINESSLIFNGLLPGDSLVVQPLINVFEGTVVTTEGDQL
jgi:RND family efflux transporter MFP subunit